MTTDFKGLSHYYGIHIIPEDEIVHNPIIGRVYHLSWSSKRGMKWRLLEVRGEWAFMETPRTRKKLTAKLKDLREINKYIAQNAWNRIRRKAGFTQITKFKRHEVI